MSAVARGRKLRSLLACDGRAPDERRALVQLMLLLATLPPPPDPVGLFPHYGKLHNAFLEACEGSDGELLEDAFLELYCHLHGHEAPYTRQERGLLDSSGGYWCHAGGVSPVLKALPWTWPATTSADFGAGNGLQLLLLQCLAPHALTVQIEISSAMIAVGRALQGWLGVREDRVRWICADVRNVRARGFDLIYLYRPVRPEGAGRRFYESFAREVAREDRSIVVLSVADCLRPFLPARFERFHYDGHLACYRSAAQHEASCQEAGERDDRGGGDGGHESGESP